MLGTGVRDMVAPQASRLCSDGGCVFACGGVSAGAGAVGGGSPVEVDIESVGVSAGVGDDVELERDVAVESESADLGAPGTGALGCDLWTA